MSDPLVLATGVHKTYTLGRRSLTVLKGIDLSVNRGDFIALRGASGAGKSTLLHLLGGLDTPNLGKILLDGRDLGKLSRKELATFRNSQVGLIFQAYYLLPELDAVENVCLPARMARKDVAEVELRARELLTRVGLKDRLEHKPYELSGGEQQRVAIARALINKPGLVLADEPTGNLDSHTGHDIIDLLCALRKEDQTTFVMATHDASVASRADRVVYLADGQVQPGPTDDPNQRSESPHGSF